MHHVHCLSERLQPRWPWRSRAAPLWSTMTARLLHSYGMPSSASIAVHCAAYRWMVGAGIGRRAQYCVSKAGCALSMSVSVYRPCAIVRRALRTGLQRWIHGVIPTYTRAARAAVLDRHLAQPLHVFGCHTGSLGGIAADAWACRPVHTPPHGALSASQGRRARPRTYSGKLRCTCICCHRWKHACAARRAPYHASVWVNGTCRACSSLSYMTCDASRSVASSAAYRSRLRTLF